MDRAHRLGQKRTVNVYRLLTKDSLEDKIMGLQRFKLDVANSVVNQDNVSLKTMDAGRLLDLFTLEKDQKAAGTPPPHPNTPCHSSCVLSSCVLGCCLWLGPCVGSNDAAGCWWRVIQAHAMPTARHYQRCSCVACMSSDSQCNSQASCAYHGAVVCSPAC